MNGAPECRVYVAGVLFCTYLRAWCCGVQLPESGDQLMRRALLRFDPFQVVGP